MENYLKALGVDAWLAFFNGYQVPKNPPIDIDQTKLFSCNSKPPHIIMDGFSRTIKSKVMSCTIAKEYWDKLKTMYEGDDKIKQVKLQKYRVQFENLKMDEKEDSVTYLEQMMLSTPSKDQEKNLNIFWLYKRS